MENSRSDPDLKNLVSELAQGRDLAKQLQNHLNLHPSSSHESREYLLQGILYSYDHALAMLTHKTSPPPPPPPSESPLPLTGSPQSDDSDQGSRKRKTGERRSEKVKVSSEAGIESQLDDGYGWRKYGQKDILGAKFPRGYYRCTYRHTHGCLATKQVQRSDEDPSIFEITYGRNHTCNRANNNEDPSPPQKEPPPMNIQTNPDLGFDNDHIFSDCNDILGNYYPDTNPELIPNLRHSDSELNPIVAATIHADFPFGPSGFDFGNSGHYP